MTTAFNLLFYSAVLATLISLLRLRIGIFFLSANQAIALRAFANIAEFGRPQSQSFLPTMLFAPERLETAAVIFCISVSLTFLSVVISARLGEPQPQDPTELPRIPTWGLYILAIYFAVLAASVKTIFTGAYADESQIRFDAPSGGVQALMLGAVIYEFYRRVRVRRLTALQAFLALLALCLVTDYSKGSTGFATGFVTTGALIFFGRGTAIRRWVPILGSIALLVGTALIVRTVRHTLHEEGTEALTSAGATLASAEESRAERAEGIEERTNGPQIAAHVLECVWLYENGYSRQWRSYYNPIIYTFQPTFLLKVLNIERPEEAAWELGRHFIHGGGILIFAEMYWNGGYLCVFLMTAALLTVAWFVDTRRNTSFNALVFTCMFTPSLLQGTQYGITYPARGISNAILAIVAIGLFRVAATSRATRNASEGLTSPDITR